MRISMAVTLLMAIVASGCANRRASAPGPTTPPGPDVSVPAAHGGLEVGDHEFALGHDGIARRYYVHIPPRLTSAEAPLVIALHGGGGTAAQLKSDIGLDAVADREGFVAVYPDGTGLLADALHTWNGGFNCCGTAQRRDVDDVGFVRAVVDDLGAKLAIDADRIAVTGHSNGAILAYRVAAEAADLVSVAAPVAGAMALHEFAPTEPVAVLHIHSVDDPRALYDGGESPPFPGTNSTVLHEPVAPALAAWADVNGCDPAPVEIDSLADGDQAAVRLEYIGCQSGGEMVHLRLSGVGHGWPGVDTGREAVVGPSTSLIDASEEVWRFASSVWGER